MPQEKKELAQQVLGQCYLLLKSTRQAMHFRDLLKSGWNKIQPEIELSGTALANLYTNLNLDTRFIPLGKGQWGLAEWHPKVARFTMPATSLFGKSYYDDHAPGPAQYSTDDPEDEDLGLPLAEEDMFHLVEDEDEDEDEDPL